MADWNEFVSGLASDPSGVSAIASTIAGVVGLFGRGRREADIIVPVQNQYGDLLTTVNQQMADPSLTVSQLQQLQILVAQGYGKFDAFTRDPRFTDGRASVQARNTIRPLVDGKNDAGIVVRADGGTLGNLQALINARGGYSLLPAGSVPLNTIPSGSTAQLVTAAGNGAGLVAGNMPMPLPLIGAGLAALFLLK